MKNLKISNCIIDPPEPIKIFSPKLPRYLKTGNNKKRKELNSKFSDQISYIYIGFPNDLNEKKINRINTTENYLNRFKKKNKIFTLNWKYFGENNNNLGCLSTKYCYNNEENNSKFIFKEIKPPLSNISSTLYLSQMIPPPAPSPR